MSRKVVALVAAAILIVSARGQAQNAPNVSQVLMFSATTPSFNVPTLSGSSYNLSRFVPAVFTETATQANLSDSTGNAVTSAGNYSVSRSFLQVNSALNASIATALSIIPLSSPASGVIVRKDPVTGAELPVNSTLGPIFTERAETIGKGHFYIGFSHQDTRFTRLNGQSLNNLSILYGGGDPSKVVFAAGSNTLSTVPATFNIGMDVRLSQDIAFLTYGATDRFDVSVGLPVVHAALAARTYNGTIYAGTGFGNNNGSTCWCVDTFTPGYPTLSQPQLGQDSMGKTGFGDVLLRLKGTLIAKPGVVVAVGGDVRFPTGDEQNYLGVGTTSVKPFAAVSFYTKPLRNGMVISPHFDVGWQISGKSILGGEIEGTPLSQSTPGGTVNYIGTPFTYTKDYLPDVFSWAVGAEIALGRRNTVIADILGNQIGWIHGIPNTMTQTISGLALPTGPNGDATNTIVPAKGSAVGLVSAGRVAFGQYSGSFGYKIRIAGNLVANFNVLVRFDDNGLTARLVPLFGVGYSF